MVIVGWVLTIMGFAFIVIGLIGAYKEVKQRGLGKKDRETPRGTAGFWEELLKILPALLEQLFKAPKWILSCLVGLVLVYFGVRLISGLPLLPM